MNLVVKTTNSNGGMSLVVILGCWTVYHMWRPGSCLRSAYLLHLLHNPFGCCVVLSHRLVSLWDFAVLRDWNLFWLIDLFPVSPKFVLLPAIVFRIREVRARVLPGTLLVFGYINSEPFPILVESWIRRIEGSEWDVIFAEFENGAIRPLINCSNPLQENISLSIVLLSLFVFQ
ncbi:Uncharacterized protein APZ42_031454 [Daphnia magna]|uniref:Uncharacterized protein n=1 Tax=Daphnia magna TaxID=35525 RepID=A0A164MUL8_9CRUS|nr:Uncharacterized protein APZ42_031454 [Daphnia magna]